MATVVMSEFQLQALSHLGRIATALEALVLEVCGTNLNPEPMSPEELAAVEARDDTSSLVDEETMAIVELVEMAGKTIPLEVYERLHIEPPDRREQAIDESVFNLPQPQPVDEEIRAYRKRLQDDLLDP